MQKNVGTQFSIDKLDFHRDRLMELLEGKDVFPITVEMNLTNVCNIKCGWCSEKPWRTKYPTSALHWQVAARAIEDMARCGVRSVTFEGSGEPTFHPQFENIAMSDVHGMTLGLITNGLKLSGFSKEVIGRFDYIRVSLDAADPKTYSFVHGCEEENFDRALTGIGQASSLRKERGVIGVSYIITPETIPGMLEAINISRSLGADYIQFKPLVGRNWMAEFFDMGEMREKAMAEDDPAGFRVYMSRMSEDEWMKPLGTQKYTFCKGHRLIGAIVATGDVVLCCNLKHKLELDKVSFGNVNEKSFEEVWKSERRHRIINIVETHELFKKKICCYCRMDALNEKIEKMEADGAPALWRVI
jgi:GTP 3',8-cyclase